ncbi:class I SAM-dependent methyltransferase [Rhodoferax ferrireducens]|uniref:class I SAM-dependent methyltransferase n=1 Tax=Rhodoferax ferrireducens TaxID=192843 RepID=UPI000E0D777B|nr:class I SAM-dependent methyltransferase [Rhodoferax ferrireducens]
MGEISDSWNKGDAYERYVGRWSRLVAHEFLDWLNPPPSLRWLDVGCGTGALTAAIWEKCQPGELIGIDPSEGFLTNARTRLDGHATFHVANALDIPLPGSAVDVVVSGLVLNFVPDTTRGLAEMRRTSVAGGTIAAYVWDYADKMELMRYFWDAAVELDSAVRELDEDVRFPLCHPDALELAFRDAKLSAIRVRPIDIATRFLDFDDYWAPFLGGQGSAPTYAMSLDEASRNKLRDRIRQRLPTESDGSIALIARAWAIQGRVGGPN